MSYLWQEFNIKTFASETVVFRDGEFCPELSTLPDTQINKKYEKPVHIIYIGEIAGNCRLNIDISVPNQPVFLSVNIKNKKPAFFDIFVKNAGKNSEMRGQIFAQNFNELNININAEHLYDDTGILIQSRILAEKNSKTVIHATAQILKNIENANSDISMSVMADKSAKIEFMPSQRINSVPQNAGHSASIYNISPDKIQFLRGAGLSGAEADVAMREAFKNDFSLF